jgi:ATP-binding cassette subfamily G (WHITE) protein 2 (PDR)
VYYGEVGEKSHILIDYFTRNGAPPCKTGDNPAEWMLSAIGAAPGSHTDVDWHQAWLNSPERVQVRQELERIKRERPQEVAADKADKANQADHDKRDAKIEKAAYAEFAAPFTVQLVTVLQRVFEQIWRTPSYIWAKFALVLVCVSDQRRASHPASVVRYLR